MRHAAVIFIFIFIVVAGLWVNPAAAQLSDEPAKGKDFGAPFDIGSVWSYVSIFDFDDRLVHPAIIDIGISHGQTREPEHACTINYVPGPLTDVSCNSSLGDYSGVMNQLWDAVNDDDGASPYRTHGERMKRRIAATINDQGDTGIAGQVAIPNLYRFGEITGFMFELDTAIARATQDGATSINISAGIPCRMLWFDDFTGDVCTNTGRLAYCALSATHTASASLSKLVNTGINGVTDYLLAATPAIKAALCGAVGTAAVAEGDLRQRINQAVQTARNQGVPVVASAGNVWDPISFGDEELELTPMAQNDVSEWGILPATANHVIAVGAVGRGDPGWPNSDFHGDRVDIWAPSNDTSPAAAFVSGVIAVAQALNPTLNPRNPQLTSAERSSIVDRIRQALQDTAYDSSHMLVYADQYRRNLINPYGFIRNVTLDLVPPFESLGYAERTDDILLPPGEPPETQQPIRLNKRYPVQLNGSIVYVPGQPAYVDTDTLAFRTPKNCGPYVATVNLYYLRDYDDLTLVKSDLPGGANMTLADTRDEFPERRRQYEIGELPADAEFTVTVQGVNAPDDNVYKVWAVVKDLSGLSCVDNDPNVQAGELKRFIEQMEMAFPRDMPPETGCLVCNTLVARGSIALAGQLHPSAGRGMPRNTRAVRFVDVTTKGRYNLSLDSGGLRNVSRLSAQLLNGRGQVVAKSSGSRLAADLAPGRYIVAVAGDVASRAPVSVGYSFLRDKGLPARAPSPLRR